MDFPISVPGIGLVDGKFIDEDALSGTPGSLIPSVWGNSITLEILNVIEAAGLTPDEDNNTQLLQAINSILSTATPEATETVLGLIRRATQAEMDEGANDTAAVSPKKLAAAVQNQTSTAFTTAGVAPAFTLTPSPAIDAYAPNQRFSVKFNTSSGVNPTINVSAKGAKNLKQYNGSGAKIAAVFAEGQVSDVWYDGTDMVVLDPLPATASLPFNYFAGFSLANNSGAPNTTVDVGAGSARDSTNTVDINLSSTFSGILQGAGAWTAGTGQNKLDTGAKANSTAYHVFSIRKTSDGTGDILYSLSATAPTMPSGYSGFRWINSIRTNSSGNIIPFININDMMYYKAPIKDVNVTGLTPGGPGTYTLSLPTGVVVEALLYAQVGGDNCSLYISSPDHTDISPVGLGSGYIGGVVIQAGGSSALEYGSGQMAVLCNTSAQVRTRYNASAGTNELAIVTAGWRVFR